jgi:hypothetical protein
MHGRRVRDERGELLKILEVLSSLGGAHPEAVFLAWARNYDPEFALGLRCEDDFLAALQATFDGLFSRFVLGVITVVQAAEDIRVNQDGHGVSRPSIVNGFAAGINRRTRASGKSDNPGAELAKPFFWGMRQRGLVSFGGLVENMGSDRGLVRAGSVGFLFEPSVGSWRDLNCKCHGKLLRNKVSEPLINRLTQNGREGPVLDHRV